MIQIRKFNEADINKKYWLNKWPKLTSREVDELEVIKQNDVPNMDSIDASIEDYEICDTLRVVDVEDFEAQSIDDLFYSQADVNISRELADEILYNKEIAPLIIVVDEQSKTEGPYILEGVHRFGAFFLMGVEKFPALVVFEYD